MTTAVWSVRQCPVFNFCHNYSWRRVQVYNFYFLNSDFRMPNLDRKDFSQLFLRVTNDSANAFGWLCLLGLCNTIRILCLLDVGKKRYPRKRQDFEVSINFNILNLLLIKFHPKIIYSVHEKKYPWESLHFQKSNFFRSYQLVSCRTSLASNCLCQIVSCQISFRTNLSTLLSRHLNVRNPFAPDGKSSGHRTRPKLWIQHYLAFRELSLSCVSHRGARIFFFLKIFPKQISAEQMSAE